jgi:hypothetical protein
VTYARSRRSNIMAINFTVELSGKAEDLYRKLTEGEGGLNQTQVFQHAFFMLQEVVERQVFTIDDKGERDRYVLKWENKERN